MSLDLLHTAYADLEPITLLRNLLERSHLEGKTVTSLQPFSQGEDQSIRFSEATAFMVQGQAFATQATTLISACHTLKEDMILWITSDEQGVRFRYGMSGAHSDVLNQLIESSFLGVQLKPLGDASMALNFKGDRERLKTQRAAVITGLPYDRASHDSLVTLDEVLSGLAGQRFDLILQATPASVEEINHVTDELTTLINLMRSMESLTVTQSSAEQFSEAFTQAQSRTHTEAWQASHTKSDTDSISSNTPAMIGAVLGGLVGLIGGPPGAAIGAKLGHSLGQAVGGSQQKQTSTSSNRSTSQSNTQSESDSKTQSRGRSVTQSITFNVVQQQASMIIELAKEHLKRFQMMKSYGSWHTRVVLCAEDDIKLRLAGGLICAALRGDQSYLDPLRFLPIEHPHELLANITKFPKFAPPLTAYPYLPRGAELSSFLASGELSLWFRPPQRQLYGLKLTPQVSFSTPMIRASTSSDPEPYITLGQLMHEGRELKRVVKGARGSVIEPIANMTLHPADLTKHCFIAGTTGSGKTTTAKRLLLELHKQGVPFLVLEPAKTEYHDLFEELIKQSKLHKTPAPLRLTLTGAKGAVNPHYTKKLSLNPWVAPQGAPLGRHVEGIKILLRSCFSMEASLPQLLESLIFEAYQALGWDDLSAVVKGDEERAFPTFEGFLSEPQGDKSLISKMFEEVRYDSTIKRNLETALKVRLRSFCRGLKRELFAGDDDVLFKELLHRPIFIELNDLNEPDIRSFLMGAIMLRLSSELEARHRAAPQEGLRHVTLLEEAHHFLLEPRGSGPSAELARESNLLLANAFAEVRAYGEGIIVADQAPAELSTAVLRNTNLKIAHRLLYERDCRAMGEAMGLSDGQMTQLRLLGVGQCVITTPREPTPALCKIDQDFF